MSTHERRPTTRNGPSGVVPVAGSTVRNRGRRRPWDNGSTEDAAKAAMASSTRGSGPSANAIALGQRYGIRPSETLGATIGKDRPEPNQSSRPCINCGFRVRVGEGTPAKSGTYGKGPAKHIGECPSSEPGLPLDQKREESLGPGVTRLTPKKGPRKYQIEGHGSYASVTTALSGMPTPFAITQWQFTEAAEAGMMAKDLHETDERAWKAKVKGFSNQVMEEAAEFGTACHNVGEKIILARLSGEEPNVDRYIEEEVHSEQHLRGEYVDRVARHTLGLLEWEGVWVAEWLGAEITCWSNEDEWAGQSDGLALCYPSTFDEDAGLYVADKGARPVISAIDWKTSKIDTFNKDPRKVSRDKYRAQLAGAYSQADFYATATTKAKKMPPVDQALIVHLANDRAYTESIGKADFERWGTVFRISKEIATQQRELTELLS